MKKFITRKKSKIKYIIIFLISFLCTIIFLIKDNKFLLNMLLKETVKEKGTTIIEYLSSPNNTLYSALNKIVSKEEFNIFNDNFDDFNYEEAKSEYIVDLSPKLNSDNPIVYIYNTHQTEEYDLKNVLDYSVKPNVMIASYILREKLNNLSIPSVVETNNVKDYLVKNNYKYNMSYHASEYFARKMEEKYPSIKYLIDIHRDSGKYENTTLIVGDKKYAKVLFVVGLEHTPRENNVGFAEKLESTLNKEFRGLSRGISYKLGPSKYGVYNQNLNGKSVLIEIGGYENKIEEVNNTVEVLSKVISEVVKEDNNA